MGHLGFSGYTFNASYGHFVILNSFFVIFMIIYSQAAKPISLIDCFDFTVSFFFNLDKFYVQRSEPGNLRLSAL